MNRFPDSWQDTDEGDANALALAFSPDNKILAAGIPRQGIRAWDINTGAELLNFNAAEPFGRKLVFSLNGKTLATNGTHVQTRIWDVSTQRDITPPNIMNASALAFSPDGKTVAYGHPNGIVLSDVTSNRYPRTRSNSYPSRIRQRANVFTRWENPSRP